MLAHLIIAFNSIGAVVLAVSTIVVAIVVGAQAVEVAIRMIRGVGGGRQFFRSGSTRGRK